MSSDLQWLLLRKSNSFIVKKLPEGPIFTREPNNLTNIHSHKFSGLANEKTVGVVDTPSGIQITTRKTKASSHSVKSARATSSIRRNSGVRRSSGIAASVAKRGYRPDLRPALIARVSALSAARNEPKPAPAKKVRGKKAKTFF